MYARTLQCAYVRAYVRHNVHTFNRRSMRVIIRITFDDDNGLITLPDDQWVSGFELSMIDLPINADDIKADLSILSFDSVDDLILIEDTMELNFDVFSGDDELIVSMVKPVLESYMNTESVIPMENINDQAIWEDWNYQSI